MVLILEEKYTKSIKELTNDYNQSAQLINLLIDMLRQAPGKPLRKHIDMEKSHLAVN